jgi:hypothetical protein
VIYDPELMARGDCQRDFKEAAAEDGIELTGQSFGWICQQGHLALPDEASSARETLSQIYAELKGDPDELASARTTKLTGDFVHEATGTLIEVDEFQHFTSARLTTLRLYSDDAPLGFDLARYKDLCKKWKREADKAFAHKDARGFGRGGRQRQRAYYDALRDFAAPAMGHPPVIRIAAPLNNGRAAYEAHQAQLARLLAGR